MYKGPKRQLSDPRQDFLNIFNKKKYHYAKTSVPVFISKHMVWLETSSTLYIIC